MDSKSEYIKRAERLEAQAKAVDDPTARAMLQALIEALYRAAGAPAATPAAEPGGAASGDPAVIAEFAASAPEFRRTASSLRRQLAVTGDPEIVDELGKLADEYDLLATVVEALAGAPETH